ncbi:cation diffusion facilitator family transporter [Idiomarina sp. HP20-50]|uniref:cation diffusion facilitator family transporter n=1 Tax=Idiomarina sp. HP20-50 TaxID=3070813 RepID=UPI00294B19DA|nr:cation diffusion facilitator family transporter [Idiomarina sp. HP20-50]MDV6317354.1 cation diffusion facilitator family transporter [Idiomarina sp. HP20-50]
MHHHHDHGSSSERIGWAFFLNLCFTIIEFIGGMLTNSTAILADAVHDLGDSISIGMAWLLDKFSRKDATHTFTYGYQRLSLVGAFINAVVLTAGSIWILFEAIPRLWNPVMPMAEGMALLAVFGVIVNGYAAFKLSHGKSLNERVLNWHLLEDVLGWVAVLIVSIILMFVDWPILDPLLSIAFTLFILVNVIRHLGSTIKLFVQASPDPEVYRQIRDQLISLELVNDAHHLHFWSLDGERHVLTAHIVVSKELECAERSRLKQQISEQLAAFELAHTTIELEYPDEACRDH